MAQAPAKQVMGSNVLVFDTMNEQMLSKFNTKHQTDLIGDVMKRGSVVGVGSGLPEHQQDLHRSRRGLGSEGAGPTGSMPGRRTNSP